MLCFFVIERHQLIGSLPLLLNDPIIFSTDFIVQDIYIDCVAAFGKVCHNQVVSRDPVFVFSVGKGCVEDCVCVTVIRYHDIFLSVA